MSEPWQELIENAEQWRLVIRCPRPSVVRFSVWIRTTISGWKRLTGELNPTRIREDVIELLAQLLELDRTRVADTDRESRRWANALVDRGATL